MASSSLSSLGLGSDGVLSYDVIDQLKEVDKTAQITPIDTKITSNSTKQTDLSTLTSLASTLKASTSALSDEISYLQRTTTVSNDAISVSVDGGTNIQDFKINVSQLAQQDIYQSNAYAATTSTFASAEDTISIEFDGTTYDFSVSSATTLSDLTDMINDKMDGKVTASLLNVGGSNPYKLVLKSDEMGADNAITIQAGTAADALGLTNIQQAKDAQFTYNGVSITRSSNTIDDLMVGVTLTLNEAQESTESTQVSITQDWSDVKEQLNNLVSAYNNLMSNLTSATSYDSSTETAGVFQGVTQLTTLSASLRKDLLALDEEGRSLMDYGISLNSSGSLEFDEDTFNEKVTSNPEDIQDYFSGSTSYGTTTFQGTSVASDALNITYGDLTINDIGIRFSTTAGATAEENALALQNAINAAGISGVTASVDTNNAIVLKSTVGEDIAITGNSTALTSLGLKATTTYGTSTTSVGIFSSLNDLLKTYTDSSTGILSIYAESLTTEETSLTEQRAKLVENLDTKYETMAKKFAAYDTLISKLTSSFQSLSYLINADSDD
ncbi:flagellar filament capping protein FliD [Sulfurospirillum deleyianum]|uniref:Flagellar hook-associated protein 2 n=1 Tax=Sulfurospirillum deleyianum (strain ATCC 51133 / DSM 6946 / 5175) TaxID=525898 RepID=D1B250_SULD5|nr:flagellar filament capping protein FliD [Sulfurospirillum deleyianum]ACZ12170.1 flagellar hook-associated 2 domain protein [Sulfurospirillum deleyianum DSM 6946]